MASKGQTKLKNVQHEADIDRQVDIRVELPGQSVQILEVWVMDQNNGPWLVAQEKARLLKDTEHNPDAFQMAVKKDALDQNHAAEPLVMSDTNRMVTYIDELNMGMLIFQAV
ncbi:hypothetical protein ElyMa_006355000 [Elysia marginata]|uniref:Kinesin-like domain-containing protein n=1 Tax=Elysia marginata TaxID=1093978 RepID=A0AAV4HKA0_9GAST|nr:hypothetical protein ElyMa_006355000 [Elysia marginata]